LQARKLGKIFVAYQFFGVELLHDVRELRHKTFFYFVTDAAAISPFSTPERFSENSIIAKLCCNHQNKAKYMSLGLIL
jgi:hypothetical protein